MIRRNGRGFGRFVRDEQGDRETPERRQLSYSDESNDGSTARSSRRDGSDDSGSGGGGLPDLRSGGSLAERGSLYEVLSIYTRV